MAANDRQVGGEHYRRGGTRKYQHWDLMADLDARYFPAVITKYTERHADKEGRADLEKAAHYAEKEHETETARRDGGRGPGRLRPTLEQEALVVRYCVDAGLDAMQTAIFHTALLRPDSTELLLSLTREYLERCYPLPLQKMEREVSAAADQMMRDFAAGTPEDGGQHAGFRTQDESGALPQDEDEHPIASGRTDHT